MIQTTMTTAEITAEQAATAAQIQTLISPEGKVRRVSQWMVQARLDAGWTRA